MSPAFWRAPAPATEARRDAEHLSEELLVRENSDHHPVVVRSSQRLQVRMEWRATPASAGRPG